jgi:hypothetical protein
MALLERPGESYDPNEGVEWFIFNTFKFGVDFPFSVADATGNYVLNPSLRACIDEVVPKGHNKFFVSMFGGNAHNALTLLEHPVPFDFILPEAPSRPRIPNTTYVPYNYVEAFLKRMTEAFLLNMATLRLAYPDQMAHVESPPPIGDNDFVLEHLEQYFTAQSDNPRIAPRELRYKLWRTHSRIISHACEGYGLPFLAAPAEGMDEDGFLIRSAYGKDSTHAGIPYGLLILKQIESRLNSRYGGWNWLG